MKTWIAGIVSIAAGAVSVSAQAPARQCLLQYESSSATSNTRTNAVRQASGAYDFFQGGGVTYHCEGQDNTLIADSAEYYGEQRLLYLIGNVHYTEPRARVNSNRMTYYQTEDRLRAEGNVDVRTSTGTTIRGPVIDYYRETTARPLSRTVATGRPTMSVVQGQASGASAEPVDIVANTIVAEGDNLVYASGNVQVTRPDLIARSDSAFLDGQREFARLMKSPSVQSRQGRPFTLRGGTIDLFSSNRLLERVLATPSGHILSEDLELVADSVDLRIAGNELQRVMAWGRASRARALSPERQIVADSIDARMPDQRLREVRAIGNAYANSDPDTTRFISSERDWIRGDVVIAEFDSLPAADTTTRPRPKRIVATGTASSFYQLAGSAQSGMLPNINYVRGGEITILFEDRVVSSVDVVDQASGVYLEPSTEADRAAPLARQPAAVPPRAGSQPGTSGGPRR